MKILLLISFLVSFSVNAITQVEFNRRIGNVINIEKILEDEGDPDTLDTSLKKIRQAKNLARLIELEGKEVTERQKKENKNKDRKKSYKFLRKFDKADLSDPVKKQKFLENVADYFNR